MARIGFTGPEGARFKDREVRLVSANGAKLRDIAALQVATGWQMEQIREFIGAKLEGVALLVAAFLSLRNAGFMVTWDEVGELTIGDIRTYVDPIDEVSDDDDTEVGEGVDPTTPATGQAGPVVASSDGLPRHALVVVEDSPL